MPLEEEELIDTETVKLCKQQLKAYNENCARVNDTTDADRKMEALKASMVQYERQQGALPPGAKGVPGAGRIEHSTNTRLGQPASFAWSNNETKEQVLGTPQASATKPPAKKKPRSEEASAQSRRAMDRLDSFQSSLSDISANLSSRSSGRQSYSTPTLTETEKKRKKLMAARDSLQNQLRFSKEVLLEDSEQDKADYEKLKTRYQKVVDALSNLEDDELFK